MPEHHVFISYSKKDKAYVKKLVVYMEELGFTVWIDERIDPGKSWWSHIRVALRDCAAFIVVMTSDSEQSHWVDTEVIHALEFQKPIFPLLLEGDSNPILSDSWSRLARYQYYDVRGNKIPEDRFFELLALDAPRETVDKGNPDKLSNTSPEIPSHDNDSFLRTKLIPQNSEPEEGTFAYYKKLPHIEVTSAPDPPTERGEIAEQPQTPYLEAAQIDFDIEPVTRNCDWTPIIRTINGIEMVLVPPGCFMMGSDNFKNAQLVHRRCIEWVFWIGRYPVTNAQYTEAIKAGICEASPYANDRRFNNPQLPVVGVSWHDALQYANWKQMRLPTETEWEYAARGPDSWQWPWGNDFKADNLVYSENSGRKPAVVGSRSGGASWVGALDTSGNVWEWCLSAWRGNYTLVEDNPIDKTNVRRVLRGGSWDYDQLYEQPASRRRSAPNDRLNDFGFRVLLTIPR